MFLIASGGLSNEMPRSAGCLHSSLSFSLIPVIPHDRSLISKATSKPNDREENPEKAAPSPMFSASCSKSSRLSGSSAPASAPGAPLLRINTWKKIRLQRLHQK